MSEPCSTGFRLNIVRHPSESRLIMPWSGDQLVLPDRSGFSGSLQSPYRSDQQWWYPHLYIWTILWAVTMLLPKKLPDKKAAFIYPAVCGLHGFLYGTLWAPSQALIFGFNFKQTLAWIGSGLLFDVRHGISNICMGLLILPLSKLLIKENGKRGL